MEDTENERYHMLLKEFTAKKLPEFYKKYNREQSSFGHEPCSAQYKDSDLFPQTLPIEKFLDIPGPIRKRKFFEDIAIGHIVEGLVTDKWADILHVRLHAVYYGPKRWISDLKIRGECDLSEFKTHSGSRRLSDSISDFDIGDHVRGVISFVDKKEWKLLISFRRSLLPDCLSHTELGAIEEERILAVSDEDDTRGYLNHLWSLPCFANPELTNNLLQHLGIDTEQPCTFLTSLSSGVDPGEYGDKLRERQSTKWSMDMVAKGVSLFKEGKHEEALTCFDQALQMHPKNVEALVARGALRANENLLKSAISDFRLALDIHPSHRNGRKYLCETLMTVAKKYEKDRMWKDASRFYKEALEIEPEQEAARERIHQIRILLSQQAIYPSLHNLQTSNFQKGLPI